jgi:hypothetical protein
MMTLTTKRAYHDSRLLRAEWMHDSDLVLTFDLDGHWNDGNSVEASVMFSRVRNRDAVEEFLRSLRERASDRKGLADVIGVTRERDRSFLVDTSQGSLVIEAPRFTEI